MLETPFFSFFPASLPSALKHLHLAQLPEIPLLTLSLLDRSVLPHLEPPKPPPAANSASKNTEQLIYLPKPGWFGPRMSTATHLHPPKGSSSAGTPSPAALNHTYDGIDVVRGSCNFGRRSPGSPLPPRSRSDALARQ